MGLGLSLGVEDYESGFQRAASGDNYGSQPNNLQVRGVH